MASRGSMSSIGQWTLVLGIALLMAVPAGAPLQHALAAPWPGAGHRSAPGPSGSAAGTTSPWGSGVGHVVNAGAGGSRVKPVRPSDGSTAVVADTLVLTNDTVEPGNFLPANGVDPVALAFDSADGDLYVADQGSASVTVIDGWTNTVIDSIPLSFWPKVIAYDPANETIYVGANSTNNLTAINNTTVVGAFDLWNWTGVDCGPTALAYDGANNYLYEACPGGTVLAFSLENETYSYVSVGAGPYALAVDNATDTIYVANGGSNSLTVIDGATQSVTQSIAVGVDPDGLALDSSNGTVYVSNYGSGNVTVFNSTTLASVTSIPLGANPTALTYDSALGYVWVVDNSSDNATVLSTTTNSVIASVVLSIGQELCPSAILLDPANQGVYVTGSSTD